MLLFLDQLRYSARTFLRTPGLTLALLLTIAAGIGSNVAVQGFARGLTQARPAMFQADRTVSVFGREGTLSPEQYRRLQARPDVFEWIGAARVAPAEVAIDGRSMAVPSAALTPGLEGLLALSLDKGVVISDRLWRSEFDGASHLEGLAVRVDGNDTRIAGVAPAWLEGLYRDRPVDVWTRLPDAAMAPGSLDLWVVGSLRRKVSARRAQEVVGPQLHVLPYTGLTPEMAEGLSRVSALLSFAAGAVFFMACVNVALFLLARAAGRAHETSIRIAIGASRLQLARALLSDSIVISTWGGAAGMLLAFWTSHIVPALLFEQDAARLVFAPDPSRIVSVSVACAGIMAVCGLLPLALARHDRPAAVLRRAIAGRARAIHHLRAGLVSTQMAGCCMLLVSFSFLLAGLRTALRTGAGIRLNRPLVASVNEKPEAGMPYFQAVEAAARSLPGLTEIVWASRLPGNQPYWQTFHIEPRDLPLRDVVLQVSWFTAASLQIFRLPPVAGRMFRLDDAGCRVAIANEAAAGQLFGAKTPGRIALDPRGAPVEIVGVVAERHAARPTLYYDGTNGSSPPRKDAPLTHFRAQAAALLDSAELSVNVVSPNYFAAMGWSMLAGDGLAGGGKTGACRVGVVNREANELFFGGRAAGAAVIDERGSRTAITGVVEAGSPGGFQRRAEPSLFLPMAQDYLARMNLIAGTRAIRDDTPAELRARIEAVPGHGSSPVLVETLERHLTRTAMAPLRIATIILGASAVLGLILGAAGLFGAMSDAALRRRQELAIRVALGAQRWRVVWQVLAEGARLAGLGFVAGMLGFGMLSRWLVRIAPAKGAPDTWVWLAAPLLLSAAVALAGVLPVRRALMVNPVAIMRDN